MIFLVSFSLLWALAVMTPGPNFFVVMRYGLTGQRSAALATAAGVASGTLIWGLAGWLGISTLFSLFPALYLGLKLVGAAYLVWLGSRLLASAIRGTIATPAIGHLSRNTKRAYLSGMMTILSNPKTAIVVPALFAASLPTNYSATTGLTAVALLVGISFIWYSFVGLVMTTSAVASRIQRLRRAIDAISGLAFIGFAGKLILSRD